MPNIPQNPTYPYGYQDPANSQRNYRPQTAQFYGNNTSNYQNYQEVSYNNNNNQRNERSFSYTNPSPPLNYHNIYPNPLHNPVNNNINQAQINLNNSRMNNNPMNLHMNHNNNMNYPYKNNNTYSFDTKKQENPTYLKPFPMNNSYVNPQQSHFQQKNREKNYVQRENKQKTHKNRHFSSSEEKTRKIHKEKKHAKNTKNREKSNNSSSSSVEITYMSFSKFNKFKGNGENLKYRKESSSISSKSRDSSVFKKKITLKFDKDEKPLVLNDEKNVILNKNIERKVVNYKVLGYEKPLITQENNLFDKMRRFLPNEIKKKNIENLEEKEKSVDFITLEKFQESEKNDKKTKNDEENAKNVQNPKIEKNAPNEENEKKPEIEKSQKSPEIWLKSPLNPSKPDEILSNSSQISSEKPLSEAEEFNFENRYFIKNPTKICFRCHKVGHYEKTCTEELIWKIQCLNCLGDHRTMYCESLVCFKCNKVGHKNKDCPMKFNRNNNNRNKIALNKTNLTNKYMISEEDKGKLMCFVCFNEGNHVNCKKIAFFKEKTPDNLYEVEENINKNQNYPLYWRGNNKYKEEIGKKFNYEKIDPHAMDSMEDLEDF